MSEEGSLNVTYDHFIPKVRRDHQSIINEGGTLLTDGIPTTTEQLSTKETISIRRSTRSNSPGYLLPRMNSANMEDDSDGKRLTHRLANLTVSTMAGDDGHRSTTPIPLLPRPSNMTELSPSTLNRLRACAGGSCSIGSNGAGYANSSANNSTTSSPCVTEVTQIATNTAAATHPSLRLPSFGTGVCNSNRDSPSTSQVSVGSIPPTLTAALLPSMRHHYDLTPVTRNTSGVPVTTVDDNTNCTDNPKNCFRHFTVTPSDDNNDTDLDDGPFLHGEHLAMPSDFLSSEQEASGVPILQPALTRILRPSINGDHAVGSGAVVPESDLESRHEHRDLPSAIEFPRRKFYSFTSRRQYEENQHDIHNEHPVLKPYQPDRQENFDIEILPEEELQRIFIARRHSRHSHNHPDTDKNHRLLQTSIPLDEETRNWSIPSIRMAQQLAGSTTSLTDATDLEDEDSLIYIHPPGNEASFGVDHPVSNILHLGQQHHGFVPTQGATIEIADVHDDLSISSRGSSLCILEGTALDENSHFRRLVNCEGPTKISDQFLPPHFSIPSDLYSDDTDSIEAVAMGGQDDENTPGLDLVLNDETLYRHNSQPDNSQADPTARSRKRKQQRLKEAYEWLQSVEVDQNVVAEAASSKFLTAGNPPDDDEGHYPQQCLHHQLLHPFVAQQIPFQRQISSPANLTAIKSSQNTNGTTSPKVSKTEEHIGGL